MALSALQILTHLIFIVILQSNIILSFTNGKTVILEFISNLTKVVQLMCQSQTRVNGQCE